MTRQRYDERIDTLSAAADRILSAVLHGRKLLSELPKARARLSDIFITRDNLVREKNKMYGRGNDND